MNQIRDSLTMLSSLIHKVALVSNAGISLTEVPRSSEDEVERQLASGLLSALLAFSKEVHKQDLQALNFHDRTVSFVSVGEFFLVAEFSSSAEDALIVSLLSRLQSNAIGYLKDKSAMELSILEANDILDNLVNTNWIENTLENLGYSRPLSKSEVYSFEIIHNVDTNNNNNEMIFSSIHTEANFEIKGDIAKKDLFVSVTELIEKGKSLSNQEVGLFTAFFPLTQFGSSVYVIASIGMEQSSVGIIQLPEESSHSLFKITPLLDREIDRLWINDPDASIVTIINRLIELRDLSQKRNSVNEDFISLTFLNKNIKKIDRALYPAVTGGRIVLVGDKPSVQIVARTLSMFTQHRFADIVEWLGKDAEDIGYNITGVSESKFKTLEKAGKITNDVTVIELSKGNVSGKISNKYLKKLFDQIKKMDGKEGTAFVLAELDSIVSKALEITSYILLPKDEATNKLKSDESPLFFKQLLSGVDIGKLDASAQQMANFIYIIGDKNTRECVIVDPAWDIDGILNIIEAEEMTLKGSLVTHYHPDHVGGSIFGMNISGLADLMGKSPRSSLCK